jgi:transposase
MIVIERSDYRFLLLHSGWGKGPNKRMTPSRRAKCRQTRYPDPKHSTVHQIGASPDKAFDADERVIEPLLAGGKTPVIPSKANRKIQRTYDKEMYKARHLIENFFCKLKLFRAIATRYDKTARNFLAGIHLASAIILLN